MVVVFCRVPSDNGYEVVDAVQQDHGSLLTVRAHPAGCRCRPGSPGDLVMSLKRAVA